MGRAIAFMMRRVSSVGRLSQPICTTGSLSVIATEEGYAIMNATALLDAIPVTASVTLLKALFRPDRAEDALSGVGEGAVVPSMEVFRRFQLSVVCAAREPREDDARSVGVPSTRRFWRVSTSSAGQANAISEGRPESRKGKNNPARLGPSFHA
ncbi:hypothetical protein Taro_050737 [Colocasia esculenta]|uniref:Uncharacterized protein n=1 Tax=Colocasia esculenta TaxID=4460 RepID=A0A843XEU4_COLES|nr:hypothetical protein [Colocasia esculenta]